MTEFPPPPPFLHSTPLLAPLDITPLADLGYLRRTRSLAHHDDSSKGEITASTARTALTAQIKDIEDEMSKTQVS